MGKLLYKKRDNYIELLIGGIFVMLLLTAAELGFVLRVLLSSFIAIVIYFLFIKNKYRVRLDYQSLILENAFETKVILHKDIINIEKSISGFTMKGYKLSEVGYKIICKEQEKISEYNVLIGRDFLNDWKLIMSEIKTS